jgi:hypothetical protein
VHKYLEDDEYGVLQQFLAANPEAGDVMPGTGGFRKLRWGDERRGKGDAEGSESSTTYWSAISRSGSLRSSERTKPRISAQIRSDNYAPRSVPN